MFSHAFDLIGHLISEGTGTPPVKLRKLSAYLRQNKLD
jgi:hypothetical protein